MESNRKRGGRGPLRGAAWGASAAAAFFGTALVLTMVAYVYGALLGIAPEFPVLLTYPFLLAASLAVTLLPVGGAATARIKTRPAAPALCLSAGGLGGFVTAALVWLAAAHSTGPIFSAFYSSASPVLRRA